MNMVMIIVYAIWMGIDADWNSALLITERPPSWAMAGGTWPQGPNESWTEIGCNISEQTGGFSIARGFLMLFMRLELEIACQ